ncbi:DnaJ family domain-containing protein [Parachitinimonas caeni]|uniref:DUF1992 domain-containing protein n=1 Tax=Parachitinimonas caeni TaxID=3031301 RepID=A0ABT7DY77_9NEIS|nr:DUF1992 domain-containing protein [Parachitinimonas caeni]MDK2124949.1 DUF1992 domain-containing protein [Parachitinimonas caeni]
MKPQLIEDEIGRHLRAAEASGELRQAASFGKPLQDAAGWQETPEALRMPFKILKEAGFVPPEVEMLRERSELAQQLADCADEVERRSLQTQLANLEQKLALRLATLQGRGQL